jgi:hypothetical protein
MSQQIVYPVSANMYPNGALQKAFNVPVGSTATVTVSGTWQFDPHQARCGAAGVGGPVNDGSFPAAGAPSACLLWYVWPAGANFPGQVNNHPPLAPQDVLGWFTSNNQQIVFGGTSPGDGDYYFYMNDNDYTDNAFSLRLDVDIQP